MKQLQLFYDEIAEKKQESKELVELFKNELEHNPKYKQFLKDLIELKERKKAIEQEALSRLGANAEKLETIKEEIKTEKEYLSDAALAALSSGQGIEEITDKWGNRLVPVFSVRFVKEK